jgi:hypothetical protein
MLLFFQLAVATVDGTAHHLIKQFEETKDGEAAWAALVDWYDGDLIKNETAEALREKLEQLQLHQGMAASEYVNRFLMRYHELDQIPGERLTSNHARYLFLRNITDPKYEITVEYLKNQGSTLHECVAAIRQRERDHLCQTIAKRKLQNTIRCFKDGKPGINDDDDEESTIHRKKVRRLTGNIETTKNGFLSIPDNKWVTLNETEKSLVQKYNAKIKHNESTEGLKVPDGLVIKSTSRRVPPKPNNTASDDENDGTNKNKSDGKGNKKGKKKITFGLDEEINVE